MPGEREKARDSEREVRREGGGESGWALFVCKKKRELFEYISLFLGLWGRNGGKRWDVGGRAGVRKREKEKTKGTGKRRAQRSRSYRTEYGVIMTKKMGRGDRRGKGGRAVRQTRVRSTAYV